MKKYSTIGIKKKQIKIGLRRSAYRPNHINQELQNRVAQMDKYLEDIEHRLFEISTRVAQSELRAGRADIRAQQADMKAAQAYMEISSANISASDSAQSASDSAQSASDASKSVDESLQIVARFETETSALNHRLIILENKLQKISRVVGIFLKPARLIVKPFRASKQAAPVIPDTTGE